MTAVDLTELESEMKVLVAALERDMPDLYLSNTRELIHVREWRVALENLCELIYEEKDGHCPAAIHEQITALARKLRVDPKAVANLRSP